MRALTLLLVMGACASTPLDPVRQACRDAALERDVIDVLIAETDAEIANLSPGQERLKLRHRLQDLGAAGVEASRSLNDCEARDGGREVTIRRADLDAFELRFQTDLRPLYASQREVGKMAPYVSAGTKYGQQ